MPLSPTGKITIINISSVCCPADSFHLTLKSTKPAKWHLLHRPLGSRKFWFRAGGEGLTQLGISLWSEEGDVDRDSRTLLPSWSGGALEGIGQFQNSSGFQRTFGFSPCVQSAQRTRQTLLACYGHCRGWDPVWTQPLWVWEKTTFFFFF